MSDQSSHCKRGAVYNYLTILSRCTSIAYLGPMHSDNLYTRLPDYLLMCSGQAPPPRWHAHVCMGDLWVGGWDLTGIWPGSQAPRSPLWLRCTVYGVRYMVYGVHYSSSSSKLMAFWNYFPCLPTRLGLGACNRCNRCL